MSASPRPAHAARSPVRTVKAPALVECRAIALLAIEAERRQAECRRAEKHRAALVTKYAEASGELYRSSELDEADRDPEIEQAMQAYRDAVRLRNRARNALRAKTRRYLP